MKNNQVQAITIYVLSVLGAVLLFFGGPDYYSPRPYRLAWDLGHICLFFLWTYVLMKTWKWFERKPLQIQFILVAVITLFLGFIIEWAQSGVGRTFSIEDVVKNIVGSTAAIVFLSPTRDALPRKLLHTIQIIVCLFVLLVIYPFARVLVDEVIARGQFPVLSSFETPFEIHRWVSLSAISIDRETVREGSASLKAPLTTDKYSGVSLLHFSSDWNNYEYLHISIFNFSQEPLRITCRIHDDQHITNGQEYSDRFNRAFILSHGWNDINIPIEDIAKAPTNRVMDLRAIADLTIFVANQETPKVIYIDDVRLVD